MNTVVLVGRLTKEPELKYTQSDSPVAILRFSLAVDRKSKKQEQKADFPSCIAFGKTAEVISQYCRKGSKIGIVGSLQTGFYTGRDGRKVYTTDVVVDSMEFMTSRAESEAESATEAPQEPPQFKPAIDEDLPFM